MRFLILVMWISTILAATVPAQGQDNTTTIITHGFQAGNTPGIWLTTMAEEIVLRGWQSGCSGVVFMYQPVSGRWDLEFAQGQSSCQNVVLIFDWADESDAQPIVAGPSWKYAQAAADALYAALRDPAYTNNGTGPNELLRDRKVHFIGHSRGTVVNSEVVRRLGSATPHYEVDQVTTLDPHPVDGIFRGVGYPSVPNVDWGDVVPTRWNNVAWSDNYWRWDIDRFDFNGIDLGCSVPYQIELAFNLKPEEGVEGGIETARFLRSILSIH